MGPQHDGAVTLAPADYWRLRFLAADAELAQVRAQLAILQAQARLQAAWPVGAVAGVAYTWDDATCTLRWPEMAVPSGAGAGPAIAPPAAGPESDGAA